MSLRRVGAQATFTFMATSVSWIGLRGPGTGIARVWLDGSLHAEVDTYSPAEIQGVVFTATGLAAASHTLTIEVTGRRNAAATNALIMVDAFDVRPRFEERDLSVTYTGVWTQENMDRAWSGTSANAGSGTAARSATAGARAEFAFTGSSVSWIGWRGPFAGVADVFLDGAFVTRVDLYSPTEELRVPVFTASALASGNPHTLRIEVTGLRNPAATNTLVFVDAFDATLPSPAPPVRRLEQTDSSITYTPASGGAWTQTSANRFWSGGTVALSTTVGDQATLTFTGTSVRWIGQRGFGTGIAHVDLDGVRVATIDTSVPLTSQEEFQATIFSRTGLPAGQHTLTIEVTGRNGELSGGTVDPVVVDALDIY